MAYYRAAALAGGIDAGASGRFARQFGHAGCALYFAVQRYLARILERPPRHRHRAADLAAAAVRRDTAVSAAQDRAQLPQDLDAGRLAAGRILAAPALKIDDLLRTELGDAVRVELAMTYGNPGIAAALENFARHNVRKTAGVALVSALLLIDHRFGVRSHHRTATLALAA
jgi:hypothetical protein